MNKSIVIIGAGPAGLTAAYELSKNPKYEITIIEAENQCGGISKTIDFIGNKIDLGGHRFFSKSDMILKWWTDIFPILIENKKEVTTQYKGKTHNLQFSNYNTTHNNQEEDVFLIKSRSSHILYNKKLFPYPLKINAHTLNLLGAKKSTQIISSFLTSQFNKKKLEVSLEDYLINRFGKHLFLTFFKSYTEKVWGKKCNEISAEWGAQRIKGLDLTEILFDYFKKSFFKAKTINQKNTKTSLIEYFLYPRKGPGQLWEKVAKLCSDRGVKIIYNQHVNKINFSNSNKIESVHFINSKGVINELKCDFLISTMDIKNLFKSFNFDIPQNIKEIAINLEYRNFITVGVKTKSLFGFTTQNIPTHDNWIYIQEDFVKVGRMQIFNNWSQEMVGENNTFWIGLEYFCSNHDDIWNSHEDEIKKLAIKELELLNICKIDQVSEMVVIKVPKAYPAYWGTYHQFHLIKEYTDKIENLFLIGRNGMHKYNNQDHSMLTAFEAVHNIENNIISKDNIWVVNTESDYHEEK